MGDGPKVAVKVGLGSGVGVAEGDGEGEGDGVALGWSASSVRMNAAAVIPAEAVCTAAGLGRGMEHPLPSIQPSNISKRKRQIRLFIFSAECFAVVSGWCVDGWLKSVPLRGNQNKNGTQRFHSFLIHNFRP